MKSAIVLLILGLTTPLLAAAQDLPSLEQMRATAERGSAEAQLEMGILYEFGYNMPKNHVTALAWYLRAAAQGNELAAKRRDQISIGMKPEELEAALKHSQELAVQPSPALAPPPAPEPEPVPTEPATTSEAPLAGPPDADKPSSTP